MNLLAAVVLCAAATKDVPVEAFHSLSISGGVQASVHKGKAPALRLLGDADDLAKVDVHVKSGQLVIEPKSMGHMGKVTAEITFTALDGLDASGGVEVVGEGLSGPKCKLGASGGVTVKLSAMSCDALDLEASGGAGVQLTGTAKKLALDASGGVQLETRAMAVSEAKVTASGGVSGGLAVADSLDADLSGGVSLKVKGHPKLLRAETSGAAKLTYEN